MKKGHLDYSKNPMFETTGLDQAINSYASPLVSRLDADWVIWGTAVMIAPGFALTANHVVTSLVKKYEKVDLDTENLSDQDVLVKYNTFILQLIDGQKGYRWSVSQYFLSPFTDVCFLRLTPLFNTKDFPLTKKIIISLPPPKIGDRVVGFGYPKSAVNVNGNEIQVSLNPKTTVGEVIEVYPQMRDRMLPFPAFRTNARFDPGMSGGPVFNSYGMLCGLICTNMPPPPDSPGVDHVSFVTLLWPSLGTKVWIKLRNHDLSERFPVRFLAEHNYIQAEGWESVKLISENTAAWDDSLL